MAESLVIYTKVIKEIIYGELGFAAGLAISVRAPVIVLYIKFHIAKIAHPPQICNPGDAIFRQFAAICKKTINYLCKTKMNMYICEKPWRT